MPPKHKAKQKSPPGQPEPPPAVVEIPAEPSKPELPQYVQGIVRGLKMQARILWRFAGRSIRSEQALLRSAIARGHDPEVIHQAIALYDQLLEQYPRWTKCRVERKVKAETGIPPRTLRRHLAKR